MKIKKQLMTALLIMYSFIGFSQIKGDDILGTWLTKDGKGKVLIEKVAGKYVGKLIWVKEKKDEPKLNTIILKNFVFNTNTYKDGVIYEPNHGHEASGSLTLNSEATMLKVTGKAFFGLFSQTEYWIKMK